jgi:uncharacterized protein
VSYALTFLILYLCLLVFVYFYQSKLIYFPEKRISSTPKDIGLPYEEIELHADDGVKLAGWFIPNTGSERFLIALNGNAGNISNRIELIERFHRLGLNVLIFDYRGYGKSSGEPTELGTYKDAEAAWRYLNETKKINPRNIIVMGQSLGGAVASYIASKYNPQGLILDSAFTSLADMGKTHYPFLPVKLLLRFEYPTLTYIKNIKCPVLVIHSKDDEIVPFSQGKKLFEAANEPKMFVEIRGSHNDAFFASQDKYIGGLKEFLKLGAFNEIGKIGR